MQMQMQILTCFFELNSKFLRFNVEILQLWDNYDLIPRPSLYMIGNSMGGSNFERHTCKRNYHNSTQNGSFRGWLKKLLLFIEMPVVRKFISRAAANLFFNRFSRDIIFSSWASLAFFDSCFLFVCLFVCLFDVL